MRRTRCARGFTLIEIMIAVALTAVIAATALAPLVFTVSSLQDAQKRWSKRVKERAGIEGIFTDVRNTIDINTWKPVRVEHKSGLSTADDDRLLVFSASPLHRNKPAGVVVYKVIADSPMENIKGGLYRWVISNAMSSSDVTDNTDNTFSTALSADSADTVNTAGTVGAANGSVASSPLDIDTDALKPADGQMVLAGVQGLRLSVWADDKWADEYEGGMPAALKAGLTVNGKKSEYEDWFPKISR